MRDRVIGVTVLFIATLAFLVCIGAVSPLRPNRDKSAALEIGNTNITGPKHASGTNGSVTFTNQTPLYVIPEAVLVKTPLGPILFANERHVLELSRLFPHHTLTNLVIWSKP